MNYIKTLLFISLFASFVGCANSKNKESKLEEITSRSDTSGNFSDVFLKIISDDKKDSTHVYVAKGLFKGKTVGLMFEVKSNMTAGLSADGEMDSGGFINRPIKIISIGKESDEFVKALSELYGKPTAMPFVKQLEVASAYSLNQEMADLDKPGYYKFKLFLGYADEDIPELYLNVNTTKKIIELFEKDQEYRSSIINVFTK